jgi:hypothetical protein
MTLSHSEPTARKTYKCIWCGEEIPVGLKHYRYSGKWDGDFQSERMHFECRDASFKYDFAHEGFEPGSFKRGTTQERND